MPDPITGIVAGTGLFTGYMGAKSQADAAQAAGQYQYLAAKEGIDETKRQFNTVQRLLEPYVSAGEGSLEQQQALLGLLGSEKQQEALNLVMQSPMFNELIQQGENAMLQNASATGGLRGGNTQGALAEYRPAMINKLITDQYSRLGGLTGIGQASAAGTGAAAQGAGLTVANLLGEQGAALAGTALAEGQANANMWGNIAQNVGVIAGGF